MTEEELRKISAEQLALLIQRQQQLLDLLLRISRERVYDLKSKK